MPTVSVVVAHSMSGLVAPLVADRLPLAGIVYLCAVLRRPGASLADDREAGVNTDIGTPNVGMEHKWLDDGFSIIPSRRGRHRRFLPRLQTGGRRLGVQPNCASRRPTGRTARRRPAGRRCRVASIVCAEDRAVNPAWSRRVARDWLNVEPIELPGAHSPFLSRPRELAALLDRLARDLFA